MKKIVALLLSLALCASLSACGEPVASESSSSGSQPTEPASQSSQGTDTPTDTPAPSEPLSPDTTSVPAATPSDDGNSTGDYVQTELWDFPRDFERYYGYDELYFVENAEKAVGKKLSEEEFYDLIPAVLRKGVGATPDKYDFWVDVTVYTNNMLKCEFPLGVYKGDSSTENALITWDDFCTLRDYYVSNGGVITASDDGNKETYGSAELEFDWGTLKMDWQRTIAVECLANIAPVPRSTIPMPDGFPENSGDAEYFAPVTEDYALLADNDVFTFSAYNATMQVTMICFDGSGNRTAAVTKWIYENDTQAEEVKANIDARDGWPTDQGEQEYHLVDNAVYVIGTADFHFLNIATKAAALEAARKYDLSYFSQP